MRLPAVTVCMLALAAALSAGCSAPRVDNTRLDGVDLVTMTDQMTASLLNAPAIAGRTADSPAWYVTLDRAVNRSNHVIPDGQKWAFMARLRAMLAQSGQLRARNIHFVMSVDRLEQVGDRSFEKDPDAIGSRNTNPTHALAATFYSATQANRETRSDAYLCAFQLLDVSTDALLWEDAYEVKHAVMRNRLD